MEVKVHGVLEGVVADEDAIFGHLVDPEQHSEGLLGPLDHLDGAADRSPLGRLAGVVLAIVKALEAVDEQEHFLALLALLLQVLGMGDDILDEQVVADDKAGVETKAFAGHLHLVLALLEAVVKDAVTLSGKGIRHRADHGRLANTGVARDKAADARRESATKKGVDPVQPGRILLAELLRHHNVVDVGSARNSLVDTQKLHFDSPFRGEKITLPDLEDKRTVSTENFGRGGDVVQRSAGLASVNAERLAAVIIGNDLHSDDSDHAVRATVEHGDRHVDGHTVVREHLEQVADGQSFVLVDHVNILPCALDKRTVSSQSTKTFVPRVYAAIREFGGPMTRFAGVQPYDRMQIATRSFVVQWGPDYHEGIFFPGNRAPHFARTIRTHSALLGEPPHARRTLTGRLELAILDLEPVEPAVGLAGRDPRRGGELLGRGQTGLLLRTPDLGEVVHHDLAHVALGVVHLGLVLVGAVHEDQCTLQALQVNRSNKKRKQIFWFVSLLIHARNSVKEAGFQPRILRLSRRRFSKLSYSLKSLPLDLNQELLVQIFNLCHISN